MRRREFLALSLSSVSAAAIDMSFAAAQSRFPEGPIKLIVPRAAGGVVDVVARFWAEQVKTRLRFAIFSGGGGVHMKANGAAVDLRCADLY